MCFSPNFCSHVHGTVPIPREIGEIALKKISQNDTLNVKSAKMNDDLHALGVQSTWIFNPKVIQYYIL